MAQLGPINRGIEAGCGYTLDVLGSALGLDTKPTTSATKVDGVQRFFLPATTRHLANPDTIYDFKPAAIVDAITDATIFIPCVAIAMAALKGPDLDLLTADLLIAFVIKCAVNIPLIVGADITHTITPMAERAGNELTRGTSQLVQAACSWIRKF